MTDRIGSEQLTFSTMIYGSGQMQGNGIAIDSTGAVWVSGYTTGRHGIPAPDSVAGFDMTLDGPIDAFLVGVRPPRGADRAELVYVTHLGGDGLEQAHGMEIDDRGIWIAGTSSGQKDVAFPTTLGALKTVQTNGSDIFLTCIRPDFDENNELYYSTLFGGKGAAVLGIRGMCMDKDGAIWVTGYAGDGYPVTPNAISQTAAGYSDVFVTCIRIEVDGTGSLVYSSFLGGSERDRGTSLLVDPLGKVWVTGTTESSQRLNFQTFPVTPNAFATKYSDYPGTDAFLTAFDTNAVAGFEESVIGSSYSGAVSLFPNPATERVAIEFCLSVASDVRIEIYDLVGNRRGTLLSERLPEGEYELDASLVHLNPGTYFCRIVIDGSVITNRIIVR